MQPSTADELQLMQLLLPITKPFDTNLIDTAYTDSTLHDLKGHSITAKTHKELQSVLTSLVRPCLVQALTIVKN